MIAAFLRRRAINPRGFSSANAIVSRALGQSFKESLDDVC